MIACVLSKQRDGLTRLVLIAADLLPKSDGSEQRKHIWMCTEAIECAFSPSG